MSWGCNVHIRHVVNNIVKLCMVRDSNWSYCGDHFIMCKNRESLCFIPEKYIILYVNYNSIKK